MIRIQSHKYERRWWKNGHWNYLYPYDRTGAATANTSRPRPDTSGNSGKGKIPKGPSTSELLALRKSAREATARAYGDKSGKSTALHKKIDVSSNKLIAALASRKGTKDFFDRMASRKAVFSGDRNANIVADRHTFSSIDKNRNQAPINADRSMQRTDRKQLADMDGAKEVTDKLISKLVERVEQGTEWLTNRRPNGGAFGRGGSSGTFGRPSKYANGR